MNVLITGASRGIGAATARRFAQGGWNVAVGYFQSRDRALVLVKELSELGVRAIAVGGDVSDPKQARALVEQAVKELGPLDALVCSAGVALPGQLLSDTSNEDWRRVMGVDLDGIFYTVRAAVPGFVCQHAGAIVTVSSMWGVTGGSYEVAYSAAKAGVAGLTRALAKELGPSNVRVNSVAPGVIATDMTANLRPEDLNALSDETPLCRIGKPEEMAEVIYFLASPAASFITGQVLSADGGMVI